ncbi:unnamed protein product [Nezara viridula]|uniref:Uncharacterized protein n=1 Tax=Nezara viridula TaxID=85310 RepID=A0A9P0EE64_NEZVI|nr:unnamed protein product [Nezara viridula]
MNIILDKSLVRNLSMRLSRSYYSRPPTYSSSMANFSSLRYEQLIPENLVEMNDEECSEIIEGNRENALESSNENQDPSDPVPVEEDNATGPWWSRVCCAAKHPIPTPVAEPDHDNEEVVVPVTEEMKRKKDLCVQNWMELIELDTEVIPVIEIPPTPEPIEPNVEPTTPLPVSRRCDIPMVFSRDEKSAFSRGTHQYYRSSWRLKPSVIGAPETVGYSE